MFSSVKFDTTAKPNYTLQVNGVQNIENNGQLYHIVTQTGEFDIIIQDGQIAQYVHQDDGSAVFSVSNPQEYTEYLELELQGDNYYA